jgi:hypothetical protein
MEVVNVVEAIEAALKDRAPKVAAKIAMEVLDPHTYQLVEDGDGHFICGRVRGEVVCASAKTPRQLNAMKGEFAREVARVLTAQEVARIYRENVRAGIEEPNRCRA